MAQQQRVICASSDVVEQGAGVRFALQWRGQKASGFVVRYRGQAHAYLNQCAHVPVELDWQEGNFFDLTRHSLICSTHGAQYHPETGRCFLGPCSGKSLQKLEVVEHENNIYLIENKESS